MATGILSVAASSHQYWRLSVALCIVALATFGAVGLAFISWLGTCWARVVMLMRDPDVVMRLFTFVVACAVLGVRFGDYPTAVWVLGGLAVVAWLVLVPMAAVDVSTRPTSDLRELVRGSWLLPSVATVSLAITMANLAILARARWLLMSATGAWILGVVFYLAVIYLVGWRVLMKPLTPGEVTPDSWVLMGALAITALAGDHIVTAVRTLNVSGDFAQWAQAVTFGAWLLASLWIPVLLYAQIWRTDQMVGSLRYQTSWWATVFPLGMYSVACAATATQLQMRSLWTVSLVFFWIGFTAWTFVATGLLRCAFKRCRINEKILSE
jgi:tellurite resistance protein TehA-like permease